MKTDHALCTMITFDNLSDNVHCLRYISELCTLKRYLPRKNIYTHETVKRVRMKNQSPHSVLIYSYVQTACKRLHTEHILKHKQI